MVSHSCSGIHLAKTLVALQGVALGAALGQLGQLRVIVGVLHLVAPLNFVQGRHSDIHMPGGDQLPHVAVEEGEQNGPDMRAVLIGVARG